MTEARIVTADEPMVTISLKEYNDIRSKAEHFENIVGLAFHGVKLGWDKDSVSLNMDDVERYINSLFLERCDFELKYLRAQEGLENE